MHARIDKLVVDPGKEDEAVRAFAYQGVAAFGKCPGYLDSSVYVDRDAHVVYVVSTWDSHRNAVGAETTVDVRDFYERLRRTSGAQGTVNVCEVVPLSRIPSPSL